MPETGVVFGRPSSRMAHRIYRSDAAEIIGKAVQDWEDPEHPGKPMPELRVGGGGKAAQTVFPGSVHESGEPIEFEPGFYREPADVAGSDLIRACQETAAASLVARAWPVEGGHRPALVIGGFLARVGWSAPRVDLFIRAVMAHVKGEHASDHARAARNAAEAHANERFDACEGGSGQTPERPMSDTAASVHRYPRKLSLRVPPELPAAIEIAARANLTSPAEYLRRAIVDALRADGVRLRDVDAGERPA
jgi:hypothetical protein